MFFEYIICLQSQIDSESDWSSTFGLIGQFFLLIVVFVGILFLAYFSTKWIASAKMGLRKNNFISIVSTLPVGGSNSVQLIKAGERYFLIGVSKEKITYITEIDENDVPKYESEQVKFPFEKYFQEYFNKNKDNDKKDEK